MVKVRSRRYRRNLMAVGVIASLVVVSYGVRIGLALGDPLIALAFAAPGVWLAAGIYRSYRSTNRIMERLSQRTMGS